MLLEPVSNEYLLILNILALTAQHMWKERLVRITAEYWPISRLPAVIFTTSFLRVIKVSPLEERRRTSRRELERSVCLHEKPASFETLAV